MTELLSEGERNFLQHHMMWGSAMYPVRRMGRHWFWESMFGVGGAPCAYKTKREAVAAVEKYIAYLMDKKAGRYQPHLLKRKATP